MPSQEDDFRRKILEGLLKETRNGRGEGTDLEVLVPSAVPGANNDSKMKRNSFQLHHSVVSASSRYFAAFPEPKKGRVIDDVDVKAFSMCVRFMYTGELSKLYPLSPNNVASVIHAADLFQIDDLKQICVEYLGRNLDASNHEQVAELADRYNIPDLKEHALCFLTNHASRQLIPKRESLMRKIRIMKHDEAQTAKRRVGLQKQLDGIEKQLKVALEKEHDQALISRWENGLATKRDGDEVPFSLGIFRRPGSVGHLVHTKDGNWSYEGRSAYKPDEGGGSDDDDDGYEDYSPPRPTKAQFESYGILYSYGTIESALSAASPGDRVYLSAGVHCAEDYSADGMKLEIDKPLELIGLGDASDVIVEVDNGGSVTNGSVALCNVTFTENRRDGNYGSEPNYAQGSGDEAVICLDASDETELVVKNCVFDLETERAYPTRVSGIFCKRGKSATIDGCNFVGGAGSAIVVINNSCRHNIPSIEITNNYFMSNGQPTFSERSAKQVFRGGKLEYEAIPSGEIIPGPASVELWRRTWNSRGRLREVLSIKMSGNEFESNLGAPLAYRVISPKDSPGSSDWQLHEGLPPNPDHLRALIPGFDLTLKENVLNNNGLQFDEDAIRRMKYTSNRKEKKICTEESDSPNCNFPDGDSLLVIEHCISQFDENSFPKSWEDDDADCYYFGDY